MATPVYPRDDMYTSNMSNELLVYEDMHKNSNGDLIKTVRVFRDKWKPGVDDDIAYTQLFEQRDALGALVPLLNVTSVIVRTYPTPVRTQVAPAP